MNEHNSIKQLKSLRKLKMMLHGAVMFSQVGILRYSLPAALQETKSERVVQLESNLKVNRLLLLLFQ